MNDQSKQIAHTIKRLPIYSKLIYKLYKEPNTTKMQKAQLLTVFGYLISPVELVPGIIPVAWQLDDIIIALLVLRRVLKSCDEDFAKNLLGMYNLSFETLDEDIKLSKTMAKNILVGTVKFLGHGMMFTSKTIYKTGKWIFEKYKNE